MRSILGAVCLQKDWRKLRVGYLKADFERKPGSGQPETKEEPSKTPDEEKKRADARKDRDAFLARAEYDRKFNEAALAKLREMGTDLFWARTVNLGQHILDEPSYLH